MQMKKDEIFGDPEMDPTAFDSSKATIVGEVFLGANVIVAPGAVLRADEGTPFYISKGTNIQDGVIMHGLLKKYVEVDGRQYSIHIGSHCSITHGVRIHGPTLILKKTFVGFGTIVHASKIGRNCYIDLGVKIKNAIIGNNCYIGVGAIINSVTISQGKYVDDGQIVNKQSMADNLPNVPKEIDEVGNHFNEEVVDVNKNLVPLYKRRREMKQNNT